MNFQVSVKNPGCIDPHVSWDHAWEEKIKSTERSSAMIDQPSPSSMDGSCMRAVVGKPVSCRSRTPPGSSQPPSKTADSRRTGWPGRPSLKDWLPGRWLIRADASLASRLSSSLASPWSRGSPSWLSSRDWPPGPQPIWADASSTSDDRSLRSPSAPAPSSRGSSSWLSSEDQQPGHRPIWADASQASRPPAPSAAAPSSRGSSSGRSSCCPDKTSTVPVRAPIDILRAISGRYFPVLDNPGWRLGRLSPKRSASQSVWTLESIRRSLTRSRVIRMVLSKSRSEYSRLPIHTYIHTLTHTQYLIFNVILDRLRIKCTYI